MLSVTSSVSWLGEMPDSRKVRVTLLGKRLLAQVAARDVHVHRQAAELGLAVAPRAQLLTAVFGRPTC